MNFPYNEEMENFALGRASAPEVAALSDLREALEGCEAGGSVEVAEKGLRKLVRKLVSAIR